MSQTDRSRSNPARSAKGEPLTQQTASQKYSPQQDDIDIQACSVTDCTGLIPTPPMNEAEEESYEELYPYLAKIPASGHSAE